eukprot:SAG11_NODE_25047_length_364_cov_0.981132_1_plen_98_part_00
MILRHPIGTLTGESAGFGITSFRCCEHARDSRYAMYVPSHGIVVVHSDIVNSSSKLIAPPTPRIIVAPTVIRIGEQRLGSGPRRRFCLPCGENNVLS